MVQTTTNGKFLSRTHQPEREFAQAIKTAVERCPEYADALSTLSEARFTTRLYADACGQLKAQYRENLPLNTCGSSRTIQRPTPRPR